MSVCSFGIWSLNIYLSFLKMLVLHVFIDFTRIELVLCKNLNVLRLRALSRRRGICFRSKCLEKRDILLHQQDQFSHRGSLFVPRK